MFPYKQMSACIAELKDVQKLCIVKHIENRDFSYTVTQQKTNHTEDFRVCVDICPITERTVVKSPGVTFDQF